LTEALVRKLIFHSVERVTKRDGVVPANGFARCIRMIGNRVFIHVPSFYSYVNERNAQIGETTVGQ